MADDEQRLRAAREALTPQPAGDMLARLPRLYWYDRDLLRQLLIQVACPLVCVGHRQPDGPDWHQWCEQKADAALEILTSVQPPIAGKKIAELIAERIEQLPLGGAAHRGWQADTRKAAAEVARAAAVAPEMPERVHLTATTGGRSYLASLLTGTPSPAVLRGVIELLREDTATATPDGTGAHDPRAAEVASVQLDEIEWTGELVEAFGATVQVGSQMPSGEYDEQMVWPDGRRASGRDRLAIISADAELDSDGLKAAAERTEARYLADRAAAQQRLAQAGKPTNTGEEN